MSTPSTLHPPPPRAPEMHKNDIPDCAVCGSRMQIARIDPSYQDGFEWRTFECTSCSNALTAKVWEDAVVPRSPDSPAPLRNVLLALVLGAMLGVGTAYLLDFLDNDWKSPEEAELVAGVPTFGVIPAYRVRKKKRG